jgi:predicted phage terminase large subunit-like protein
MTLFSPEEYRCLLRNDFNAFIERSFYEVTPQREFLPSRHIEVISSKLEECRAGKLKRLIINLPPRNLKSHCASVALPAWLLGHNPSLEIICVSYGQDLADKFARDCRAVMNSAWYKQVFSTRLSDRQAVHDFETTGKGRRRATSVGGVLTGLGADIIIIDDALKPDEALSETRRKAVNEWYDGALLSRLNNKADGIIIIVMQRLHQEDLVGHVLEQDQWEVLSFPAIAEEDQTFPIEGAFGRSAFVRKKGEALHPERESLANLEVIRKTSGEYNFVSQYQQNPAPPGGAMIKTKWIKRYEPKDLPSRFHITVQSWDTANKATELADYSVCTTWGCYDRKAYLLDVYRERINYPELKRAVRLLSERFSPNTILIEDKASGTQLIQDLQAEGIFRITPYKPIAGMDKVMRLHAQASWFENGHVFLPASASFVQDYIAEIAGFPGAKFDDQVDSTTQALDHMNVPSSMEIWARLASQL